MVCQKLCQNAVSGRGSLEESTFDCTVASTEGYPLSSVRNPAWFMISWIAHDYTTQYTGNNNDSKNNSNNNNDKNIHNNKTMTTINIMTKIYNSTS